MHFVCSLAKPGTTRNFGGTDDLEGMDQSKPKWYALQAGYHNHGGNLSRFK